MSMELEDDLVSKAAGHIMYVHARGYRVLKDGQVKSFTGRILRLRERYKGRGRRAEDSPYLEFCAANTEGQSRGVMVHRLQAYQKFGLEMFVPGLVVRHKNDLTRDNSWGNILLGTYAENIMDKPPEVRKAQARAAALARRKLSMSQARLLRQQYAVGISVSDLCVEYSLGPSSVYAIINNQTYQE